MASLEPASTEDLINIVEGVSPEFINCTLRWAELLRIAYPVGNDDWRVEPLVGHILTSLGE